MSIHKVAMYTAKPVPARRRTARHGYAVATTAIICATMICMALALGLPPRHADADTPTASLPTATPAPEVVRLGCLPTATPTAAPIRRAAYREYDQDAETVDALASVYWAECNTEAEKLAVTQLIANRAAHGAPFAGSIKGAAMQGHEFNRGRISDRNRELARVNLNKILTQQAGEWAGITIPRTALYMTREAGVLIFLDAQLQEVWRDG